jgi:hypothetical protein
MRSGTRGDLLEQLAADTVAIGVGMQVHDVPDQAAGAWMGHGQADDAAIMLGYPGALAARTMAQRARNKRQIGHTATLRLDARPVVGRDLGATGATLERCQRHHVDGA